MKKRYLTVAWMVVAGVLSSSLVSAQDQGN